MGTIALPIALLGATGSLGRAIGRLLAEAGQPYRAVSRSQMGLQVRFPPETLAQPVLWDPKESPATIRTALEDITTAIYLAGMPLWDFKQHIWLTQQVLDAAREGGVKRFLLVSSNWAYGAPQSNPVSESHPLAATTSKGRIRAEQEMLVRSAHRDGLLQTAVLRVADFYGPHVEESYLWSAFRGARNGVHAQLMSPADTPHEFVYVADAARTILRMLETDGIWTGEPGKALGAAWNLGGVAPTTLRAMLEQIFAEAGKPADYEIPPAWKMRLVAMMNPYIRELREMHYLLETPVLLDDSALAGALSGLAKTGYTQGIRETLPTVRVGR
jgi:nucleoside-diphosphate-sugar epimerase